MKMHRQIGGPVVVLLLGLVAAPAQDVPREITTNDLEYFSRWLGLTNDQEQVLGGFHSKYVEQRASELRPRIRMYHDDEQQAYNAVWGNSRANHGLLAEEYYVPLWRKRDTLIADVDAFDESFLLSIESLLSEQQRSRMQRVRLGRQRLLLTRHLDQLPEGNVDLVALIESFPLSEAAYDRIDRELIFEFEPMYVKNLIAAKDAKLERRRKAWEIYDLQYQSIRPEISAYEQFEMQKRIGRLKKRIGRPRIAASERLVRLNREWKLRAEQILPEDVVPLFHEQYLQRAYPLVHPDPESAEHFFAYLFDSADLRDDQLELVRQQYDRWHTQHALLTTDMEEANYHWYWATYSSDDSPIGNLPQARAELKRLGLEREALNVKQVALVSRFLLPEQVAAFPSRFKEPGDVSRPWDHQYESDRKSRQEEKRLLEEVAEAKRKREQEREDATDDDGDDPNQ